jgi:hypothetical protein
LHLNHLLGPLFVSESGGVALGNRFLAANKIRVTIDVSEKPALFGVFYVGHAFAAQILDEGR